MLEIDEFMPGEVLLADITGLRRCTALSGSQHLPPCGRLRMAFLLTNHIFMTNSPLNSWMQVPGQKHILV